MERSAVVRRRPLLEEILQQVPIDLQTTSVSTQNKGWALKISTKIGTRFTEDQKKYLLEKFNQGIAKNEKLDPILVSQQMRKERKSNGKPRFSKKDFLNEQQIQSYFSREAAKRRKEPANEEINQE